MRHYGIQQSLGFVLWLEHFKSGNDIWVCMRWGKNYWEGVSRNVYLFWNGFGNDWREMFHIPL